MLSCATTEDEKEDKSGSCTHSQLSGNYTNANCTGTLSGGVFKNYCNDTTNIDTCKTYTSCNNGFHYSDSQVGIKGKSCAANGYPLACTGGFNKAATLTNCPY